MCKSSSSSHALPSTTTSSRRRRSPSTTGTGTGTTTASSASSSAATASTSSGPRHTTPSTTTTNSSTSSRSSLAAARASLPDQPVLYSFHELAAATNNFLAKRSPSDATFWRCHLRSHHAALFQLRPLSIPALTPAAALARVARFHHASLARLLGACPAGAHVYLAYALPPGACTLAAYLSSSSSSSSSSRAGGDNSGGTNSVVLRSWLSRVQVAADVAQGIEYAHAHADAAHGRVSPSAVLLAPDAHGVRAALTHFGAGHFAAPDDDPTGPQPSKEKGKAADVRAFGVLLLCLLSGEAAESRYRFDRATKQFARVSVVDTAAEAVRSGRVRSWVDRRLGDSFPVAAAERLVEVGLRCAADEDADGKEERPEMAWVAGKVSRVYVESRAWERALQPPSDSDLSSVALAPR